MALPNIFKMLFENVGAGPKLRADILPLATLDTPGVVRPDETTLDVVNGVLGIKIKATSTQLITTSGNYIAPYDGFYLVECQGGGGPGGSSRRSGTSGLVVAGGGGAGSYQIAVVYLRKGDIIPCIIGAGGVPAATGQVIGIPGGTTSFGALLSADGGLGGLGQSDYSSTQAYYGRGGKAGKGGQDGSSAIAYNLSLSTGTSNCRGYAGNGGNSPFGVGGEGVIVSETVNTATPGNPGTGYGSGGSGAGGHNVTAIGGTGAPGCIRVSFLGV